MKNKSILCNLIVPLITILVIGITVQSILISEKSSKTATDLSMRLAMESMERHTSDIRDVGGRAYNMITVLSASVGRFMFTETGRADTIEVMSDALNASYFIMGVWADFEPNAFDGNDANFRNAAPYEDETGRFSPFAYRFEIGGKLKYAPLREYENQLNGEIFTKALREGRICISEPYDFMLDGKITRAFNISAPVLRDGKIVGVIGMDFSPEYLTHHANSALAFETGRYFVLSPTGKFILHPSKDLILRDYRETWMSDLSGEIEELSAKRGYVQALNKSSETGEAAYFTGRTLNFANTEDFWVVGSLTSAGDVTRSSRSLVIFTAISGAVLAILIVFCVITIVGGNLRELPKIAAAAEKLAVGDIDVELHDVPAELTRNEIGGLKFSFDKLVRSMQKQVAAVQRIGGGDYSFTIVPQSEHDFLNISLARMANSLSDMFRHIENAREEAVQLREKAETANATKSAFLANMSHELRTPLNAIIGLSELTLDIEGLDGDAKSNVEKVYNSGMTLLSIVNDILDISKIEAGRLELVPTKYDIPSLINDTAVLNIVRIGSKPIEFHLHVSPELPTMLFGDELRVKQILNNLLSNAFKYTKKGSVDWFIESRVDGDDCRLIFRIKDTGIGIKQEDAPLLFSDYNQLDMESNRKVEGTGLGLAITKKMIALMDGEISVESEYGAGATFTAVIKQKLVADVVHIGETVARSLESFDYADSKRSRNTKLVRVQLPYAHVLVVDDVPTNLDVAKGILKPYAMKIDCVTSGAAAIELIRAGEPHYNAIFMDHMMPEMDGIEATRIIRQEIGTEYARTVPILALTANAIVGNEQLFLEHGFQAFLSKPIDIFAMDAAIRQWIRDKTREQELAAEQGPDMPRERRARSDRRACNERRSGLDRRELNAEIKGIDWKLGLDRFGGDEESYINVLKSYAKNTPPLLDQVRDVTEATLADYAIVVHGIKSSSRSIGAEQIGTLAERLEKASNSGDLTFVLNSNNWFIGIVEELLRSLSEHLLKFDEKHLREQRDAPDPNVLRGLAQSCREYDIDGIDAAMGELDAYSYADGADLVEWLHAQIRVSGFRAVAERLESEK